MNDLRTMSRLRSIWNHMKTRCYNPNYHYYKRYGGRGITVCDEWRENFRAFADWALTNGYANDLSIDRIDNDQGYSPENCRFIDQKGQLRNMSRNRVIEKDGERHTMAEWAEITGISKSTISSRIHFLGWDEIRAITEEVEKHDRRIKE